jgi:hypothetical protein
MRLTDMIEIFRDVNANITGTSTKGVLPAQDLSYADFTKYYIANVNGKKGHYLVFEFTNSYISLTIDNLTTEDIRSVANYIIDLMIEESYSPQSKLKQLYSFL